MPPTVKTGNRNPYDSGGPFILDISQLINTIAPERDTPLLGLLGSVVNAEDAPNASLGLSTLSKPCTSFKHSWLNDALVPSNGTITAGYVAAAGTITVGATQVTYFQVDDVVRVRSTAVAAPNNDVFFLVTAVGATTITVTAIQNDQNCNNNDTWTIIGTARKVGSNANTSAKYTVLTQTDNFVQIFSDDAIVTGTEMSVEQYGIDDPFDREIQKVCQRMIVEFERALHWGIRSSVVPADSTTASRMGGIFYYLRVAAGGLTQNLSGAPITEDALDTAIDTMWRAGGTPDTILTNSIGLRTMKKMLIPFVRTTRAETGLGVAMERYEAPHGFQLDVVLDRHLEDTDFIILNRNHIGVGPLEGNGRPRHFLAEEIPTSGADRRQVRVLGEYTTEVRNPMASHLWIYGGTSTMPT